mgnify:FL=1
MRTVTKSIVGVVSLGVLATSWALGEASATNTFSSNYAGVGAGTAAPTNSASPTPTPAATTPAPTPTGPTAAPTTKPTASATPTPTQTKTPSASTVTKTGAAESYRYGVIQVSVTKSGGAITSINLVQAGATGGRQAAFDPLVNAALQAQGTNFGNLGGATFTTETFKTALESALAKF